MMERVNPELLAQFPPAVIDAIKQAVADSEQFDSYLPHPYPQQENFSGRKRELEILNNWFKHSPPMLALVSIGGMGKSMLAWHWLQENILKQNNAPRGVIWWSFYERDGGFEDFLDHALLYVSKAQIDPKSIPSAYNRMQCLYYILARQRFLLVLDGLERKLRAYANLSAAYQADEIREDRQGDFRSCPDPNLAAFLKNLAHESTSTRTLITSRLFPRELYRLAGCNRYYLRRFLPGEAADFFHTEGIEAERDEIKSVSAPLEYHPLSLRLLIRLLKEDPQYQGKIEGAKQIGVIKDGLHPDLKEGENLSRLLVHIYNRLPGEEQTLLSQIAASRTSLDHKTLRIFKPEGEEKKFKELLKKLRRRGLLLFEPRFERYDLHPLVRKYAYERLADKAGTHARLRDCLSKGIKAEKIKTRTDLNPLIELYHHTVKSNNYDDAADLFNDCLATLYFVFCDYQLCIELLSALFPEGEHSPPRMKDEAVQAWALDALALSYSNCGQPARSVPLMTQASKVYERRNNQKRTAIVLGNLAQDQIAMGELDVAETNLQHNLELCLKIEDELAKAVAHQDLGRLRIYQGKFEQAEKELLLSSEYCRKSHDQQVLCLDEAYRSLAAILQNDYPRALEAAKGAHQLAKLEYNKQDIIWAEWLLGAAYRGNNQLAEAEAHLQKAINRCRQINMVEVEAEILLELARVRREQAMTTARSLSDKPRASTNDLAKNLLSQTTTEAHNLAREALGIANQCQYRLQQADIHLFLAQLALDGEDKYKALREAKAAYERASCGYKPTLDAIEHFMQKL